MKIVNIVFVFALMLFIFAIVLGGPTSPLPMASINRPFKSVDFSDLPVLRNYISKDGVVLAYRHYEQVNKVLIGSVILIHGSSGSSKSMHVLAKAFAEAGFSAYAVDVRGHGASGKKGTISYIGQLEDDLDAFSQVISLRSPATLVGFSAGGGFALRFAGSKRQDKFQSYLLMSPFINYDAPNQRPGNGGWANVGIPRLIALSALNGIGVTAFNDLPVISFALDDEAKKTLTPEYSYSLMTNLNPPMNYKAAIKTVNKPVAIVAGFNDEAFRTENLEKIFRDEGKDWSVTLLPDVGHISLTLETQAVDAAVKLVKQLQSK